MSPALESGVLTSGSPGESQMDLYCLEPLISPGILFEQLEGAKINYGMFYLKKKKLSLSGSASLSLLSCS